MTIESAEWKDILQILHETFSIWSPGLDRSLYHSYIYQQITHPWSRGNFRYLVYRQAKRVLASLKLYTMEFAARGHLYKVGGIGAVFTQPQERGFGFASCLIKATKDFCYSQGYDALYLFSDIDPRFYARLGFQEQSAYEFFIHLPSSENDVQGNCLSADYAQQESQGVRISPLENSDVPDLSRHYQRWLRRQGYGVVRSELYWSYKLARELYLHSYSRWAWPRLELLNLEVPSVDSGYVIFEQSSSTIRVLEIIGMEEAQRKLWNLIFNLAIQRGMRRIRGWESACPEFVSEPVFAERTWGIPMILPMRKEVAAWQGIQPCPLLELDHL